MNYMEMNNVRHSFDATPQFSSSSESQKSVSKTDETLAATKLQQLKNAFDKQFIEGFTPAYFASVMGTGISSSILYNFPYPAHWLKICGIIMWAISIAFFILTTAFFMIWLYKNPKNLIKIHRDPSIAVFMGCYPMGYISLLNLLNSLVGKDWIIGIYVLWWIAVILSLYTSCIIFYMSLLAKFHKSPNKMDPKNLHSTMILPIVTLTVASSYGGIITAELPSVKLKVITIIVSYILWVNAVTLAFIIVTVYFWKLFVYKIPATPMVFTSFLPIGFMGQGGYGILLVGDNIYNLIWEHRKTVANHLAYAKDVSSVMSSEALALVIGNTVLYICAFASLFLTSFGYFFTFLAVISCFSKIRPFTSHHNKSHTYNPINGTRAINRIFTGLIKFNKGFWAMTFPLGTMSLANTEISRVFHNLEAFRVIGAIYGVTLLVITISCILGTLYKIFKTLNRILLSNNSKKHSIV